MKTPRKPFKGPAEGGAYVGNAKSGRVRRDEFTRQAEWPRETAEPAAAPEPSAPPSATAAAKTGVKKEASDA